MKRFLTLLTVALTCLGLFAATAEAKRFGGGGSFGKQRTITQQQAPKTPDSTAASSTTKPATGNRWLGSLAGLAAGLGLGALLSSLGMGGSLGMILLVMLAAWLVMSLLGKSRKQQPAMQYAGAGAPYHEPAVTQPLMAGSQASDSVASTSIPADFPVENFLRSAKTTFIRLQAANDRKDLDDIREYTTPEMFAEISMQMHERDDSPQKTDVLSLQADLLEVAQEGDIAIASVRFAGQLRENDSAPENVDEIWHVMKNLKDDKSVWLLAGIQQTTLH